MLMPAAMLVLLVLASIMVDFAIVGMRSRELHNAASAAAEQVVARSLAHSGLRLDAPPTVHVSVDGREVTVTVHATHEYLFAGVVPGADDTFTVDVTASARAVVAGEQ
jgi:hypothetical protein